MTLSRWRRIATGIAAGVIVLCAALLGASFRDSNNGVSVASDLRPPAAIPIPEDDVAGEATEDAEAAEEAGDDAASDPVRVIEVEDLPDDSEAAETDTDSTPEASEPETANSDSGDATDSAAADDAPDTGEAADTGDAGDSGGSGDTNDADSTDGADSGDAAEPDSSADAAESSDESATPAAPTAAPATPAAPLTATDDALGTGGGVDDAECALDRLVIYAGARVGGVAGRIRTALAQAGFGAGCPTPVTVLASNCPLQFAGVLGSGSGYDPAKSFVASSASVDRETMTAVMGEVGFGGSAIDILDFGFVNPDRPGEQWMAIFIPPSFAGWESLASRAGLTPSSQSLCAASGQLAG